jgi:hypothetical protein
MGIGGAELTEAGSARVTIIGGREEPADASDGFA